MAVVIPMSWTEKSLFMKVSTKEKTISPILTPMQPTNTWSTIHILEVINGSGSHGLLIKLSIRFHIMVTPSQQQPVHHPM